MTNLEQITKKTTPNVLQNGSYIVEHTPEMKSNHLKIRLLEAKKERLYKLQRQLRNDCIFYDETGKLNRKNRIDDALFRESMKAKDEALGLRVKNERLFKSHNKGLAMGLISHFKPQ